jgi:hypothetical protein
MSNPPVRTCNESPHVYEPRRYIPPMCVYRVSGGNSSVSSELYGEIVRNTIRNRTIGPLGCIKHITLWTDPIYIIEIWMVLVHNRGIFPMTEPIMMSIRREDVDYDTIRCEEKKLIQGWVPSTHPSGVVMVLYMDDNFAFCHTVD